MKTLLGRLAALCVLGLHPLSGQSAADPSLPGPGNPPPALLTQTFPTRDKAVVSFRVKNPQAFLYDSGVTFAPGSYARWAKGRKDLVVHNTRENLDLVAALLADAREPKPPAPKPQYLADAATARGQLAGSYSYENHLELLRLRLDQTGSYHYTADADIGTMEDSAGTWRLRRGRVVLTPTSGDNPRSRNFFVLVDGPDRKLVPGEVLEIRNLRPLLKFYALHREETPASTPAP